MSLSDFALKSAKSREKPYRLSDGDGLFLLVQPNGSKLWQLRYRFLEKENVLSFGKYPHIALADARRKRDDAKQLLAAGTNPAAQKKLDKITALTDRRCWRTRSCAERERNSGTSSRYPARGGL